MNPNNDGKRGAGKKKGKSKLSSLGNSCAQSRRYSDSLVLCMPHHATHNARLSCLLCTGSNVRNAKELHTRTSRYRATAAKLVVAVLVVVCFLIVTLASAQGLDDARLDSSTPRVFSSAPPLPLDHDSAAVLSPGGNEVAQQYTFGGDNLVLVLLENGFLHAYQLESGKLAWSADVGGNMISVEVELPPSRDTVLRDPLALPFLVRGNSLFTRTPFYTYNPGASSTLDTAELLGNLPGYLRPYFFMNISTLLRRQTVFFGGTDVFVTTSVEVADLDSSTGRYVYYQRKGGDRHRGSSSNISSRQGHRKAARKLSSMVFSAHNELVPILHVVRYNIVLHVVRADEYSWSITLSQLQLSPRTSVAAMLRRTAETAARAEAKEYNTEDNPRFFSHVMRDLLDYDAEQQEMRRRNRKQQRQRRRSSGESGEDPNATSGDAMQLSPEAATAAILDALGRRRTQVAEYVSRVLSMQQYNHSQIRLRNLLEDTTKWTANLPSSTSRAGAAATSTEVDSVNVDETDRDSSSGSNSHAEDDDEAAVAAKLPSSLTSTQVIASYVWVSGAQHVFRIPVQHFVGADVSTGEVDEYGVYVEGATDERQGSYYSDGSADDAPRRLRFTPTTFDGAVVPTQGTVGGLQLVPFLHRAGNPADMRHALMALDVEGDEREGEELDRYYHEGRWWESHTLATSSYLSPLPSSPLNGPDNVFAGFSSAGDVIRTGLAWRTAGIISFHVLCLAGSIAFLCAGVPPRNQLQRAWAQADRNRDRLSHTSASRPQSTLLVPQDLMNGSNNSGAASPFSPMTDGFSVDSPAQGGIDAAVKTRSLSPARFDSNDDGSDGGKMETQRWSEGAAARPHTHHDIAVLPQKWDVRTPEEVYTMMREESEDKMSPFAGTGSTTASAGEGKGLTSSHTTQLSRRSPTERRSPPAAIMATSTTTANNGRQIALRGSQGVCSSSSTSASSADGDNAAGENDRDDDDDSEEIDLGERWWVRVQRRPRLPSVRTVDEALSDKTSSVSFSPVNDGGDGSCSAAEEESKLFQLHFKVLEKIGFGGEGCVFCVEHRVTHARYAIKAILIHEQDEERVVQEAVLHSSFDHANVVRFYFCWIEDIAVSTADRLQLCNIGEDGLDTMSMGFSNRSLPVSSPTTEDVLADDDRADSMAGDTYHMLFIQMEYFPRGTLADWLRSRKGFYRLEVLRFMQNIADGLAYLHNQDVVHRDLKPTNIFVSNANVLKIGDFGLAKRRIATTNSNGDLASNVVGGQQERSVVGGSPLYCSPEQMHGDPVNKPSDIFSFGIIAVEMLCNFSTLHERIRILTDAHQGVLPAELERDFSEEVQIIKPLLASEPQHRPPLRKVQRQLTRLIDTLEEDSEQDTEDVSHSPSQPAAPPLRPAHAQSAGPLNPAHASVNRNVATAESLSASRKFIVADVVHAATMAAAASSSSSPLVEWHTAELSTASSASASPPRSQRQPHQQQAQQQPRFARRGSTSSAHSSSFVRNRNSYHDRRYTSPTSSPGAEVAAGSSCNETASQGGASSASPTELIVTDPYGPPMMPVTYVGDADLSSILKRDLQDRTISPPD